MQINRYQYLPYVDGDEEEQQRVEALCAEGLWLIQNGGAPGWDDRYKAHKAAVREQQAKHSNMLESH